MVRYPDPVHLPNIFIFIIGLLLLLYSFIFAGIGDWNEKNLYRYTTAFLLFACISPYIIRISALDLDTVVSFTRQYLRPYHAHLGTIAFGIAIFHGLYEGRCNRYIELSMLIFSFLLVTGLALFLKKLPSEAKRQAYFLHSHQLLVFLLLTLIVIGHILEEL